MSDSKKEEIDRRVFKGNERPPQASRARRADHVDLCCRELKIGFLFRAFSFAHRMTKRTRMSTVEGLCDCLAQWRALRVFNNHCRPRERLKCHPMQSDRATKRNDHDGAADEAKHARETSERPAQCQHSDAAFCPLLFRGKTPVALVEVNCPADAPDSQRLPPGS
jgi:hypothetical protein